MRQQNGSFDSRITNLANEAIAAVQPQNGLSDKTLTENPPPNLGLCVTKIDFKDLFNATIAADAARLESILQFGTALGVAPRKTTTSEKEKLIATFATASFEPPPSATHVSARAWKAS